MRKVFTDMINYTAMKTAEVELLKKEVVAEIIRYEIEAKGEGSGFSAHSQSVFASHYDIL